MSSFDQRAYSPTQLRRNDFVDVGLEQLGAAPDQFLETLRIAEDAALYSGAQLMISAGLYLGPPTLPSQLWRHLAQCPDLQTLRISLAEDRNGPGLSSRGTSEFRSALRLNFERLYRTLGAVDEIELTVGSGCEPTAVAEFAQMLGDVGYRVIVQLDDRSIPPLWLDAFHGIRHAQLMLVGD